MRAVQQVIEDLSQQEGFGTVVLTNASGLSLATSANRQEAEALAAVVAEMLRASAGIGTRLGWGAMSEMLLLAEDAQQGLLCRQFAAGEHTFVLALFIKPKYAYWEATTQAIQQIKQIWHS